MGGGWGVDGGWLGGGWGVAGLWLGGGWLHWLDVFATTDPRLDIVLLETEATNKTY